MKTLGYLQELLAIPSPTGFTQEVVAYLLQTLENLGLEAQVSPKGNVRVTLPGKEEGPARLLTAHVDTLGAMVRAIKPDGRLKLDRVGGFPWNMIEGENCLVHLANGSTVSGTILLHQTSTHVYKEAGTLERSQDNMEVRLDAKVTKAEETQALGIQVGDFVSFDSRTQLTETGFVKSRFLDDKASVAILLALLEEIQSQEIHLPVTTHVMFSTFEEVGHGANSSIPNQVVEYLAVDMGAMGDDQATDEYTVSICSKDASGPYHYGFRRQLEALAQESGIPYKIDIYPFYGSDASAAMSAGWDVRHALIGPGIESSHSYERTHVDSLKATSDLIFRYLQSPLMEG
ncbi:MULTISPECIES: M42 family metallopeptidase [unclassified Streptococcus]|uniref:M42 family metallopeptidase n=1 Tax=unclassified Streptococcus TaxID=2608887 RepID=UPI001072368F|nr:MULTISPECIES: M42 family metallopeptidase [unclassified Streptococcus]MBF0806197.1 M42 family metallopeptidase [Streptococcus sp. 19428wA2_WM07]TFU28220.1 M42 family peptidase [Streptococcus sp. WM07]